VEQLENIGRGNDFPQELIDLGRDFIEDGKWSEYFQKRNDSAMFDYYNDRYHTKKAEYKERSQMRTLTKEDFIAVDEGPCYEDTEIFVNEITDHGEWQIKSDFSGNLFYSIKQDDFISEKPLGIQILKLKAIPKLGGTKK
jgi:hypothetical protein